MKIQPINFYNFNHTFNNKSLKNHNPNIHNSINELPNFQNYFLPFLGGKSLDLIKTNNSLDNSECPKDIKDMMEEEISLNPDTKKTLQDIHFKKYKGILDCYSLDDLKKQYPEFKNVASVYDVMSKKGGFIYNFQEGNSEVFSQNEDLTLQLIKLYWAKGFSLLDLSKYIGENSKSRDSFHLYHVFKRLNIPTMNPKYGQILKLSNKKYNEDLYNAIVIKKAEVKEAKQQAQEGEPVIIPRGPLSEAHKQHISEGLKRYYQNNPDAIYNMSKRQKEFYQNNPQEKENISIAADYAWNKTQEGRSVKKHLAKFSKKFNANIKENELNLREEMSKTSKDALDAFWKRNPWAKEHFSNAMTKGWAKAKEIKNSTIESDIKYPVFYFTTIPLAARDEFLNWAKKQGQPVEKWTNVGTMRIVDRNCSENQGKEESKYASQINKSTEYYFDRVNKPAAFKIVNARMITLLSILNDLINHPKRLPEKIKDDPDAINELIAVYQIVNEEKQFFYLDREFNITCLPGISTPELDIITGMIIPMLCNYDAEGFEKYHNKRLNHVYNIISNESVKEAVERYL